MRIIAIVNQKGGSGKTTTTVNLAAALAEMNRSVLMVDLDVQMNATEWMGDFENEPGAYDVIVNNGDILNNILNTNIQNISIVPASRYLMKADKQLAGEIAAEKNLLEQLKKLPKKRFDYVLMDCPPQLGILTINALTAAREILIPVETNILALKGVVRLMETFEQIKKRINPKLAIAGVVACKVNKQTRQTRDAMKVLKKRFGKQLYKTVIRQNVRLSEAPNFQLPIMQYDRGCHGTKDYRALAKEVLKQEK